MDAVGGLMMSMGKMARALREIQVQFVKSEKLAALGDAASSIAQNIRRPFADSNDAATVGLSAPDKAPDARTFAEIIAGTDQFEYWVHSFLAYLRPLHLHRAPCDLNQLLRDALSALGQQVAAKAVQPVQELSPLPSVAADPLWMEQVFLAILTDAIEASAHGGSLSIGSAADSHGVILTIVDDGKGIPRDVQARVFDADFTTCADGVGLGLMMAKKIVEAHSGNIARHSEEGRGTTVTIRIPFRAAQPCH
jgi:signal transduction histidine kinase